MIVLQSIYTYETGTGKVFVVPNPVECRDFKHLYGIVKIDGAEREVVGVEYFAHSPPWRAGEKIGVKVRAYR